MSLVRAAPTHPDAPADRLARWVATHLGRSLHVRHLDAGSCNGCDWEIAALLNPYHVQRPGSTVASPPFGPAARDGMVTRGAGRAAPYEAMPSHGSSSRWEPARSAAAC
jgi:hypothetical protein